MRVDGSYSVSAGRQTVWDALLSPSSLSACIPGAGELHQLSEDHYEVLLNVGIGAIRGAFTATVSVTDKREPESFKMVVEGKGGGGTIRGEGVIGLAERAGETDIQIEGDAQVTGVIARVGQRLLGTVSKTLMNQFFACIKSRIEGG